MNRLRKRVVEWAHEPLSWRVVLIGGVLCFAWPFVGQPLGIVCSLAGLVVVTARPR